MNYRRLGSVRVSKAKRLKPHLTNVIETFVSLGTPTVSYILNFEDDLTGFFSLILIVGGGTRDPRLWGTLKLYGIIKLEQLYIVVRCLTVISHFECP